MSKTAHTFDPLQQLASATAMDDELSEKLLQALISSQAFPINLAWIVPLLQYKHISSLTTHLKRHFKKDLDYQKLTSGSRTHTYFISVDCFRGICNYARHSERRTLAQYWLKVMGDPIQLDTNNNNTNNLPNPNFINSSNSINIPTSTTSMTSLPSQPSSGVPVVAKHYHMNSTSSDTDSCPSSPEALERLHATASSALELENTPSLTSSSSSLVEKGEVTTAAASLYHYNLSSAHSSSSSSSPSPANTLSSSSSASSINAPKLPLKKDFTRVNILSKKRKIDTLSSPPSTPSNMMTSNPGSSSTPWNQSISNETEQDKERENFGIKPNLKILSELALGLR